MSSSPSSWHFGAAELRPPERQLLVHGQPVPIGARAWDVLLVLVEHRRRVVSRQELLDLVWPDVAVEDHNLSVQVAQLRKFLGPGAIATVPGRGYRFTMPVGEGDAGPDTSSPDLHFQPGAVLPSSVPLFGRDDDLAALLRLLSDHPLVTVAGAGGVGKTALALAAARSSHIGHPGNCIWVDLAAIADPALVFAAVAQALQLPVGRGDAPLPALIAGLKPLHMLVVLDNAEHVIDAVAQFAAAVLAGAPDVRLLITSQAGLRIEGERVFRLEPLPVPPPGTGVDEAMTFGAIALFVDQARSATRRFELTDTNVDVVSSLCRQLDGIALALKLAAARLPLLGLHGVESRLADRLRLLVSPMRDAPARQQTLRAALDWTCGLLTSLEQAVFRRLGVFVGGFSLELAVKAASDITADEAALMDPLAGLVDRSLVVVSETDPPRYRLLESARDYALQELSSKGELHAAQQRHAKAILDHFKLADERQWVNEDEPILSMAAPELGNLRAALDWGADNDPQLAVALVGAASRSFVVLGLSHEHRRRSAALEPRLCSVGDPVIAAKYWLERARTQAWFSYEEMHDCARRAETLYRSLHDAKGIYVSLAYVVSSGLASASESQKRLDEMGSRECPTWPLRVRMFRCFAEYNFNLYHGDAGGALHAAQSGLALSRAAGAERWATMFELWVINSELNLGQLDVALAHCDEVLVRERRHQAGLLIVPLGFRVRILLLQGQLAEARTTLVEFFHTCRMAEWEGQRDFAGLYVQLALMERRYVAAARLIGFADRAWQHLGRTTRFSREMRALAHARIGREMDAKMMESLIAEGALMNEEAMIAQALGTDDPAAHCS